MLGLFKLLRFIWTHPLNANKRMAAISRFLRWQIASRIMPHRIAIPFVEDTRLLTGRSMTGATGNWYCGLHEPEEMAFVLHALSSGESFVDVGANIGSYTILAGGAVGANVICVEPIPQTFGVLNDNIVLNGLTGNVQAVCCGVSDRPGEMHFTSALDTMNRVLLPGESLPRVSVPVDTLDSICRNFRPVVMKIDVEGHEMSVLRGAGAILGSPELQAVLMETNGSGEKYGVDDGDIFAVMEGHGFTPCSYDFLNRTIRPMRGGEKNTVFVRDIETLSAKCKAAQRYRTINGSV